MRDLPRGTALVAGVNHYVGQLKPLKSAVADAQALAATLRDAHNYDVTLLTDEAASARALIAALESTSLQAQEEERPFLFYFAGHGVARGDGNDGPQGFLLGQDAVATEPASWLSMTAVRAALEALPSRHLLVILDCCFAGAFRWSATRDSSLETEPLYDSQFQRYLSGTAWQALTSASHDELALDVAPGHDNTRDGTAHAGHSPFAAALLRGLAGEADTSRPGVEPDGVITATELYQFTFDLLVPDEGESHQTPGIWPLRNDNTGQFVFRNPLQPLNTRKDLPLNDANNPWLGLAAYSQDEAPLFFGRGRCVRELLSRIRDTSASRLIAVVGASGTGKSSVVKAGVLPTLTSADDTWTVCHSARLGPAPLQELDAARVELSRAGGKKLLLIDQFEELYTQCHDNAERNAYLRALRDLLDHGDVDRVVLTLRSDFEPRPARRGALSDIWKTSRYVVPAFTGDELRECIEGPANARAVYFEPANLVATLVDEVMAMPGALPMLSFALAEMYRQAQARRRQSGAHDRALTDADYAASGGVVGALHRRANELYKGRSDAEQTTIRRLFLRMTAQDGARLSRRRVTRAELNFDAPDSDTQRQVDSLVDQYVQARLLVAEADTLEPAHDALIVAWERLQQWLSDAGPQTLVRATWRGASDWHASQRARGTTWHDDPRLAQARSELDQFNLLEREFVLTSVAVRQSRFRRLVAGAVLTVAVIAGAAIVALIQRQAAVEQQAIAEQQRDRATASALQANAQAQSNPFVRARLMHEISARGLPPPARAAEIARTAITDMLGRAPSVEANWGGYDVRRDVGSNYIAVQTLRYDTRNRQLFVWNSWANEPRDFLPLQPDDDTDRGAWEDRATTRLHKTHYLDNQRSVAARLQGGGLAYWPDGQKETPRLDMKQGVTDVAADATGSAVLVAQDGRARLLRLDANGVASSEQLGAQSSGIISVALDRTAHNAVTGTLDGQVQVWDIASRRLRATRALSSAVTHVAIGERTGLVVAANDKGELAAWQADGPDNPIWTGRCGNRVASVTISPGEQIIGAVCAGEAYLWRTDQSGTGHRVARPDDASLDRVRIVLWPGSFEHDGLWLLGFSATQFIQAWPVMTAAATEPDTTASAAVSQSFRLASTEPYGNTVNVTSDDGANAREFSLGTPICSAQVVGEQLLLRGANGRVEVRAIASGAVLAAMDAIDRATLTAAGQLVGFRVAHIDEPMDGSSPGGATTCAPYWDRFEESSVTETHVRLADLISGRSLEAVAKMSNMSWPDTFEVVTNIDGQYLLAVIDDGGFFSSLLFNLRSTEEATTQRISGQLFRHAAFSPDGEQLLIAADRMNPNIFHDDPKLYATSSVAQPWRVLKGQDFVRHAAFSSDGQSLVTIDCYGDAYVWNTDGSGDPIIVRTQGKDSPPICGPGLPDDTPSRQPRAFFSADGNHLFTQLGDADVQRWPIRFSALNTSLEGGGYLCLTAQQREQFFGESLTVARAAYDQCMLDLGIDLAY
ncbi:MAG: caspase family protein [Gammaproteobacteria bacterium]